MQVSEPTLSMLQRESYVLAYKMKDYSSIRFDSPRHRTESQMNFANGKPHTVFSTAIKLPRKNR